MRRLAAALASAAGLLGVNAPAHATILTYDGAICGIVGGDPCLDGALIGLFYGSTSQVRVSYTDGLFNLAGPDNLFFASSGFSDLKNAAYGDDPGYNSEVEIGSLGGPVTLKSFDIGFLPGLIPQAYNIDVGILTSTQFFILNGTGSASQHLHFDVNVTDPSFVNIQFPAGYTAIDNINIGVPEPATWTMMLVGLGGLGAALRSRRRLAAAQLS